MTAPLTDQQLAALAAEVDKPGPHHFARADVVAALDLIARLRAELEKARAKVRAVTLVRCWTNEDGKGFVFADDLRTALAAPADPCRAEPVHQTGCPNNRPA